MPYVVERGFGSFSQDPTEIGDTISEWLGDDELLARMSSKAKQASQPMVRLSNTSSAIKTQNARSHNFPRYCCSHTTQRPVVTGQIASQLPNLSRHIGQVIEPCHHICGWPIDEVAGSSFQSTTTAIGRVTREKADSTSTAAPVRSYRKQTQATELICEDIGEMLVCRDDSVGAAGRCTLVIDTFIVE